MNGIGLWTFLITMFIQTAICFRLWVCIGFGAIFLLYAFVYFPITFYKHQVPARSHAIDYYLETMVEKDLNAEQMRLADVLVARISQYVRDPTASAAVSARMVRMGFTDTDPFAKFAESDWKAMGDALVEDGVSVANIARARVALTNT
jgi:hypothetical protein